MRIHKISETRSSEDSKNSRRAKNDCFGDSQREGGHRRLYSESPAENVLGKIIKLFAKGPQKKGPRLTTEKKGKELKLRIHGLARKKSSVSRAGSEKPYYQCT